MGAANALPTAGRPDDGNRRFGNSTLDLAGFNQQIGSLAVASGAPAAGQIIGNSSTSSIATLAISGGTSTFAGTIQDTLGSGNQQVGLWVTGSASLTLTGPNTFTGATTINSGSLLQIGNGTSGELFAATTWRTTARLVFNHADSLTYSGAISGSGSLVQQGNGLLTLSGSNS